MAEVDNLPVHRFAAVAKGLRIDFQIIQLAESFFLWIGSGPPKLSDISLALQTSYGKTPLATTVLGKSTTDQHSSTLSQKLAKKTGKQVIVSYNVASEDPELHQEVVAVVFEKLKEHPEQF